MGIILPDWWFLFDLCKGLLGFIYFARPRTEDEQEKASNSIVAKYMLYLLEAVIVIALIIPAII